MDVCTAHGRGGATGYWLGCLVEATIVIDSIVTPTVSSSHMSI
jgi:hypothetical protein